MAGAVKTPVIAGNWKMHKGPESARKFCREFVQVAPPAGRRTILVFPPAVSVGVVRDALSEHRIGVGVQNIHWEDKGAYTGEISAPMIVGLATWAIIGHSERRQYDGETDERVGRKVASAVAHGLRLVALGLALGLLPAVLGVLLAGRFLPGTVPWPQVLASVMAALAGAGLAASIGPARLAARTAPFRVLRDG